MKNVTLFIIIIPGLMFISFGKEATTNPNILQVEDIYEGGYLLHLDVSGEHGKVCSETDLGRFDFSDAIAAFEAYEAEGYTDWYLPSKDALNEMYTNLYLKEIGGFDDNFYWSSTEISVYSEWRQYFGSGFQHGNWHVRAVRAF